METALFEYINPRYLLGIIDEPKQLLQPIVGYTREPLLPLEDACEPLIGIVPCLQAHIWIAKQNSKNPADGLTQDESAAIRLYTMEWDADETGLRGSLYAHLNKTLKQIDRIKLHPWFRYLKLLLTALVKLPTAPRQTVWRGVRKNVSEDYSPGAESAWWAFSSCTTSLSVLESELYLGATGTRTLFSIEIFNGRTIRSHSHFITEDEILLLPGTFFEVKSLLNPASDLHIIHLQQKIPPYDLLEPPFEGAHIFPPTEVDRSKNYTLDDDIKNYKRPWYKKKIFILGAILAALIIILVILLAAILGSRHKKSTQSSTSVTAISYNVSTYPAMSVGLAFYPFDRNVLDLYSLRDGTINGGPATYIPGYVGYGQAIVLNQTNSTSISVANPFNLSRTDFTFELYLYLYENVMSAGIIQFSSGLQLNITNGVLRMILNSQNILYSFTVLAINAWHHIAIVYSSTQSTTTLFINGLSDNDLEYLILSTDSENENITMIIGAGYEGAIDQLLISLEAKTYQEILWDATVVAYYPFEEQTNSISLDFGPNGLNATVAGAQSIVGQVRNAINFNISGAYFQASGFTVLNIPEHAFTVALWIRPSTTPGIFLTIANSISCLLVLGLRSSDNHLVAYLPNSTDTNTGASLIGSELIINQWTHIAFTWSNVNQAQLYQNTAWQGSNQNATKLNNGYGSPMTITLGMYRDKANCAGGDGLDSTKQFTGSLDEFYVFSRALEQNEIETLNSTTN